MRCPSLARAIATALVAGGAGCGNAVTEAPVAAGGADASPADAREGGVARKDAGVMDPCAAFLGDPSRSPQIELTVLVADGSQMPLKDGDPSNGQLLCANCHRWKTAITPNYRERGAALMPKEKAHARHR